MRKFFKRLFITLFLLGAIGTITVIAFNLINHATYAARMYPSAADVPTDSPRIAIVFGAGLMAQRPADAGVVRSSGNGR